MAHVGPVHLGLFSGKGTKPQVGLSHRPGPQRRHQMTERRAAAAITTFLNHNVQTTGRQGRELGQRLLDEWYVQVNQSRRFGRRCTQHAGDCQNAPHGVTVKAQLAGDGADSPVIGQVQTQDLGTKFRGNDYYATTRGGTGGASGSGGGTNSGAFDALRQFLAVHQRVSADECRSVVQGESEKSGTLVRLEALPGGKFVDWVSLVLMAGYLGAAVACVLACLFDRRECALFFPFSEATPKPTGLIRCCRWSSGTACQITDIGGDDSPLDRTGRYVNERPGVLFKK